MTPLFVFPLLIFFPLMATSEISVNGRNLVRYCSTNQRDAIGSIGVVVAQSSRVGTEQRIAVEMAARDFNRWSHCSKLALHFRDSQGNSARAASAVTELINKKKVHVILGPLALQEATLLWELDKATKNIPIISIAPTFASPQLFPSQPSSFIRMSTDINIQMQCIASIVSHFGWRKVTALHESSNRFSPDSGLVTHFSDALQAEDSVIQDHLAFPGVGSQPNPEKFIEEGLSKLRSKNNKIFVILQASLDFSMILFEKAKKLGMMEKGYAWIVSDDVGSLLDSINSSFVQSHMQGVIGLRINYQETTQAFQAFAQRFRRKYRSEYPEEDKYSDPSIHALRAYDSTWAVAKAIQNSKGNLSSDELQNSILSCNFDGLSGKISFKNGEFLQKPFYQLVNVIGKSYKLIAFWSAEFGFSEDLIKQDGQVTEQDNNCIRPANDLGSIYWPGGELAVPKKFTLDISMEKPLRIGVPATGVFHYFVNVSFDQIRNETTITGFSIQVFEASVKQLPYNLPYVFVPYYGSYDQIVAAVHNKSLDAAVGDIGIVADRYEIVDFSQPYLETGIVMVVTQKPDVITTRFMVLKAFELRTWILIAALSVLTGMVVWLNEYANNNPEFRDPFPQNIGSMLWFSVTILSFTQRESIKSNLSRLVLAIWLFVTMVVAIFFTASITSAMTVPKIEPSVADIDHMLQTDAPVGCNFNTFIVRFLINVLHFKPENVRQISSISDYPEAFQRGDIKAAFLTIPHAKVFLAKYCNSYTIAGPSYKLGGYGFVFQKGSPLANDFSEAILKITLTGTINKLENHMLTALNCSSSTWGSDNEGTGKIGIEPFFFLFLVTVCLLVVAFVNAVARLLVRHCTIHGSIQSWLMNRRALKWALLICTRCFTKFATRFSRIPTIRRPNNEMIMC